MSTYTHEVRATVPRHGWTPRSRRYLVERGDTGLGGDAYGLSGRQRGRRAYGPEAPGGRAYGPDGSPYPPDDGYPASGEHEEDEAGAGRPGEVEADDYCPPLPRPGGMGPPPQPLPQPGPPPQRQPA